MRVANVEPLVTNGDMSQASVTSTSQQVERAFGFSIQAIYTGAPVGTFKLQISINGTNWVDYPGSVAAIIGAGSFLWNVTDVMFQYVQLVYTRTSGTGTLNVICLYKGA